MWARPAFPSRYNKNNDSFIRLLKGRRIYRIVCVNGYWLQIDHYITEFATDGKKIIYHHIGITDISSVLFHYLMLADKSSLLSLEELTFEMMADVLFEM